MSENKLFAEYKNTKIALYGLSIETEKALKQFENDYKIVGLLDSFKEEGELYGKPVISFRDAVEKGVELIIVVARPGSCRAITKRIGNQCRDKGIVLLDIRGKELLERNEIVYDFSNTIGITRAQLSAKIQEADIISFDLFDTLVMRQTLFPSDVIRYVDCRLREQGIVIKDFYNKRLGSEKELSKYTVPTLHEIYDDVIRKLDGDSKNYNVSGAQLAELEWNIDYELIIPRKEVCDILRDAVADGKSVYIVSDTYYDKQQLAEILNKCGITEYTEILSSSDYRTGKTQNLFAVLKNKENGKSYLHIGDDIVADIEGARRFGLQTCRLFSGLDLLETIGGLGFTDDMDSLQECLKIGMFISRLFNSPFQFEADDKRITVSDIYDVGYLFCAPMISDFVLWFYQKMDEHKPDNIWFGARDGYFIKKMYAYLMEMHKKEDQSIYFLTSRTAAVRAGVQDEKDIQYVDEMKFSGTLEENLKERFGLSADDIDCGNISNHESGLLKYKTAILESAKKAHENYLKYIEGLGIKKGNTAFFDFVAKGTSQMYIQKLIENHLKGFYFLQLEPDYMSDKGLDIEAFYENGKANLCAVYDNYYILETLLTAPHPSVQGFDESGQSIYAPETRSEKDICCFERAQKGILDYFKTYIKLCPENGRTINKELDEIFLKLIHKVKIDDFNFLNLVVEDPFFNRMTNITDVL